MGQGQRLVGEAVGSCSHVVTVHGVALYSYFSRQLLDVSVIVALIGSLFIKQSQNHPFIIIVKMEYKCKGTGSNK